MRPVFLFYADFCQPFVNCVTRIGCIIAPNGDACFMCGIWGNDASDAGDTINKWLTEIGIK